MPLTSTKNAGKTSFVKEVLYDDPYANPAAVNAAWTAAGMDGTISGALVNKTRALLGLTGNLRSKPAKTKAVANQKPAYTGKKRGRKARQTTSEPSNGMTRVETRGRRSARSESLAELEAEIDRLLFKVMGIGGLSEIEAGLRETRRRLYASFAF